MRTGRGCGEGARDAISRGLSRGLESRTDYKMWMDRADTPRQGDLDGRGNLSERVLVDFSAWFLNLCLDQVSFMGELFDLTNLGGRFDRMVATDESLPPKTSPLLREALVRGEFERGEVSRLTGLPDRSARRVLKAVLDAGLLGADSPKGAVSLRFPTAALEVLFPRLYPSS